MCYIVSASSVWVLQRMQCCTATEMSSTDSQLIFLLKNSRFCLVSFIIIQDQLWELKSFSWIWLICNTYIPWILNHQFRCSWWIFPSKQRFQHEACIHQSCIQICQRLYQFLRAEWADCIPHTLGNFLVWRPEMAASPNTHCGEKLSLELMWLLEALIQVHSSVFYSSSSSSETIWTTCCYTTATLCICARDVEVAIIRVMKLIWSVANCRSLAWISELWWYWTGSSSSKMERRVCEGWSIWAWKLQQVQVLTNLKFMRINYSQALILFCSNWYSIHEIYFPSCKCAFRVWLHIILWVAWK